MRSLLLMFTLIAAVTVQVLTAGELSKTTDRRYSEIRDLTVLPYYEALQTGEIASLRRYLSAKRYATNRVLMEHNTEYPDYLRKHFEGAGFELLKLTEDEKSKRVSALVRIYWPDGRETQEALGLVEEPSDNSDISWKIDRD